VQPPADPEPFVSILSSFWLSGRWLGIAALAMAGWLVGCATPPADPAERAQFIHNNDPLEPLNRKTFAVNLFIDHMLFRPAAKAYVAIVPDDARHAIHHVLNNMKEPTLFFNNVLQGEFERAWITLGRFAVNSTIGFGGLVDVMALDGVERQPADFGQTLYVWGVPSGPYLILPILGPSNPRDAIGGGVDSYADPFTIMAKNEDVTEALTTRFIIGGVEDRAAALDILDDLEKNSVDFYAQLRSLAQQHRDAELHHGKVQTPDISPGLYDDPSAGQPAPPPAKSSNARPAAQQQIASVYRLPQQRATTAAAHQSGRRRQGHGLHRQAAAKPSHFGRLSRCVRPRCAGRGAERAHRPHLAAAAQQIPNGASPIH